jgi:putative Mg2+ transporter-C (MgtC) family protein
MTSIYVAQNFSSLNTNTDPSRIAAGIVTGIGFLGAGTIIREQASVRGLTTAASLWGVAAIGMALGCGFYKAAIFTAVAIFLVLFVMGTIVRRIKDKKGAAADTEEDE